MSSRIYRRKLRQPVASPNPRPRSETYTQVASSCKHTCAIYGNGGLHCWGQNLSGQLGDGTTTNSAISVVVPG